MGFMAGRRGRGTGGSADGEREGGFNLGESYDIKALHSDNREPQMNPCERRFTAT